MQTSQVKFCQFKNSLFGLFLHLSCIYTTNHAFNHGDFFKIINQIHLT